MLTVVPDIADGDHRPANSPACGALIDERVPEGARRMLAEVLKAKVDAYIAYMAALVALAVPVAIVVLVAFADARSGVGRRSVVRDGHHVPREILAAAGAVEIAVREVSDKRADDVTGEGGRLSSPLVALVRAGAALGNGAPFGNGALVRCPQEAAA